jgi:hypothetical protein
MDSDSESKKKPYPPPAWTEVTREQAIKIVVEHKNWSEEEAAEFLDSMRKQPPPNNADEKRKRAA